MHPYRNFICFLLLRHVAFSQEKTDSLILNSLHFLDKNLPINFKTEEQYIFVLYEGEYYIVDKYINKEKIISREKIIYEIDKMTDNKYDFYLKIVSEYRGTFEVVKEGERCKFVNLTYVHTSPPLISRPRMK